MRLTDGIGKAAVLVALCNRNMVVLACNEVV